MPCRPRWALADRPPTDMDDDHRTLGDLTGRPDHVCMYLLYPRKEGLSPWTKTACSMALVVCLALFIIGMSYLLDTFFRRPGRGAELHKLFNMTYNTVKKVPLGHRPKHLQHTHGHVLVEHGIRGMVRPLRRHPRRMVTTKGPPFGSWTLAPVCMPYILYLHKLIHFCIAYFRDTAKDIALKDFCHHTNGGLVPGQPEVRRTLLVSHWKNNRKRKNVSAPTLQQV